MREFKEDQLPKKSLLSLQIDLNKFSPATDEEKQQHETMRESTTFFRDGMRKLFKNPLAVASLIVLAVLLVIIAVVPLGLSLFLFPDDRGQRQARQDGQEPRAPLSIRKTSSRPSKRGRRSSRTSSGPMNCAATTLSAWCTARACRCWWACSPA